MAESIRSKFPGHCDQCDQLYPRGTPIRTDGRGWIHVECPGPPPDPFRYAPDFIKKHIAECQKENHDDHAI